MNRDTPEESDEDCNVCGSAIEVGSAWARCSNRTCLTRERDCSLGTDATDAELAEYWEQQAAELQSELNDAITKEELRQNALDAFDDYVHAESRIDAEEAEARVNVYLSHLDVGWGWVNEEHQ